MVDCASACATATLTMVMITMSSGQSNGQYNLGICYFQGKGVAKDQAQAARWWRKAAEQGDR
eukprot:SAG22_NODE_136_length_18095_cov_19.897255_8_plen_62_part_00